MSAAYDSLSRVSQMTYPTGFAVNNVYSSRGDLLEVRDVVNDTVFWSAGSQHGLNSEHIWTPKNRSPSPPH